MELLLQMKIIKHCDVVFRSRISIINSTLIENTEDLDILIPMCNLLKCNDSCSLALGNL